MKKDEMSRFALTEAMKQKFIDALTPELAILRAKADVSQEELANFAGISRQTYGAIERKNKKMSWNTYLSLILFYDYNKNTHTMLRSLSAFPHEFIKQINEGDEPTDFALGMLFKADTENIVESLDEQAMHTIKTVLMVEYSRCNKMSSEAVIKFFEGINLTKNDRFDRNRSTDTALKNIKRTRKNER